MFLARQKGWADSKGHPEGPGVCMTEFKVIPRNLVLGGSSRRIGTPWVKSWLAEPLGCLHVSVPSLYRDCHC